MRFDSSSLSFTASRIGFKQIFSIIKLIQQILKSAKTNQTQTDLLTFPLYMIINFMF
jgi:hypothetical protein